MLNPPRRKPKGAGPSVDEDSFLTMRDEIMTLKKNAAKDRQKKKEMNTQLTILQRKLSKVTSAPEGQVSEGHEELLSRVQAQNRDLLRQNRDMADKLSAKRNPRKSPPVHMGRSSASKRPIKASPARSTGVWEPPRGESAGDSGFESKMRATLQERNIQIKTLLEEKDRLAKQLERGGGAAGDMQDLEHQAKSRQVQLDLAKSKYEQLHANFSALKLNHERALAQVDELNKDMQDERRKTSSLGHDKKLFQVTKDRVAELEQQIDRLRKEKQDAEEQNAKLTEQALSGHASMAYKEKIKDLERRIRDLSDTNSKMEVSVKTHADEVAKLKIKLQAQGKTYGSYQDEKLKIETDLAQLQRQNQELSEKVSVFTGDTGINIDDLEKALAMVKKGHVPDVAASGPVKGLESSGQDVTALKREKAELVQDLDKLQQMLQLQDRINTDYKAEIDAHVDKFKQMQREYDYKLQEANRTLSARSEQVRTLETRLRNQVYSLSRTQQREGTLRDSVLHGNSADILDDDVASEISDGIETDVGDGQNIFEFTVRELLLDLSFMADSGTPPATFFTFDFFEHETQTTPVVSGTQQRLDYTSQFVVKVDAFFFNYLSTKTMKLELLQSCGGMDFRPIACCEVSFRPLLDALSTAAASTTNAPEPQFVEVTSDMIAISGGKTTPMMRSVIGTVTYRLRFRHPAVQPIFEACLNARCVGQAIHLIQDRLAHVGRSQGTALPANIGSGTSGTESRELCILVSAVNGLRTRTADAAPAPYVHYKLLDFPDHFTSSGQGSTCNFNDLECYQLQVGDDDSPVLRWLSTGTIDFTVFDDADDKADFHFGMAKVRLSDLTEYPRGKIVAEVALEGADTKPNGTLAVEIFWSHAVSNSGELPDKLSTSASSSKKETGASMPDATATVAEQMQDTLSGSPVVVESAASAPSDVEELYPTDGTVSDQSSIVTPPVNLSKKPNERDASNGNHSVVANQPTVTSVEVGTAEPHAGAMSLGARGTAPDIVIQIHRIEILEELANNEDCTQVYVAVEWLQDADAADGEGAKELETPSKNKASVIEFEGNEATKAEKQHVYGTEIKRKIAEGKVEVEFALVNDPGGEDAECDDLGVATVDLCTVIMEAKTDFVQQTLPIIGEGEKKLANIVVSITALEAMQSLV